MDAEECHSSESGWTMYIGSPIDEDGHYCGIDEENEDYGGTQADPEVESDDSMASDASSGPSHYGINPLGNNGQGLQKAEEEEEEEYDEDHEYCSDHKKESKKHKENQIAGKKGEKKEMVFLNSKGKASVQGGDKVKVRKNNNHWVGTRK